MKQPSLLQQLLRELKDTWGYTSEEIYDIRDKMKAYATAACIDSEVREEAFQLDPDH